MARAHNARIASGRPGVQAVKVGADAVTEEGALHDDILAECNRLRWYVVHARMDVPSTTACGVPDFIIATDIRHGGVAVTLWLEAKTRKGKPSPAQRDAGHWLAHNGHRHAYVRSTADFHREVAAARASTDRPAKR